MKRLNKLTSLIALAILGLVLAFSPLVSVQAQPQKMVRVLIGFNTRPGISVEQQMIKDAGGRIGYAYHRIPVVAATLPESAVQALQKSANVAYIEEDGVVHALDQQLPWGVAQIHADLVHPYNEGVGVKVAIIDTGIDLDHPDLNVQGGLSCVSYTTSCDDDHGHGTHVAGIVAALNNNIGVVGVAPEAALYAVKVLDSAGSGNWSNVIEGIEWAIDNGMQVINMSLGGLSGSTALETVCNDAWNAGIIVVAAAGNNDAAGTVLYPAQYDSVIAVAATDSTNTRAGFSDTGPQVELAAPGVNIYSTYKGGAYANMSGTSMASPHVAGAAALVIASGITDANGNGRINDEVRQRLDATAHDLGTIGRDIQYGYGLVDASNAYKAESDRANIDHYSVSNISSPQVAGTPFSVTIQAQDQSNNNISSDSESVNITLGKADTGATPLSISTTNGAATISMTMTVAQTSQTLTFTGVNSGKSGTSNSFNVNAAAIPPVPTLKLPTSSSTVSNLIPRLEWNASTGAISYGLQVSTNYTFTKLVVNQTGITNTYYDVPSGKLSWSTTYYWRANASNDNGTSAWSGYWQFKTPSKPQPPAAPTLISPTNNSTVSNLIPKLQWNASTGATSYGLQVSTNSRFTSIVISQTGITDTQYIPSTNLNWSTTYYWRANASNDNGTSSWSAYRQFKTPSKPQPPAAPSLTSPTNNSTVSNLVPKLQWKASTGATSYGLQVSTNSRFTSIVISQTGITDTQYDVPSGVLSGNTTYYWRVNASNDNGTSSWSAYRQFKTPSTVVSKRGQIFGQGTQGTLDIDSILESSATIPN
jgi:subtilisin